MHTGRGKHPHTPTHTPPHTHAQAHTRTCTDACTHTHTHTHTHAHTHTHTHEHTHKQHTWAHKGTHVRAHAHTNACTDEDGGRHGQALTHARTDTEKETDTDTAVGWSVLRDSTMWSTDRDIVLRFTFHKKLTTPFGYPSSEPLPGHGFACEFFHQQSSPELHAADFSRPNTLHYIGSNVCEVTGHRTICFPVHYMRTCCGKMTSTLSSLD
jgi:hypothetical protein